MEIEITDFREYQKNTLQGFITLRLTNVGLEIRDLALHEKNSSRWLQLPAKPYEKTDGTTGWSRMICFYDKQTDSRFQTAALKSLDEYLQTNSSNAGPNNNSEPDIPF